MVRTEGVFKTQFWSWHNFGAFIGLKQVNDLYNKQLFSWMKKINIKEENLKSIDNYAGTKLALFHANSALLNSYHHP